MNFKSCYFFSFMIFHNSITIRYSSMCRKFRFNIYYLGKAIFKLNTSKMTNHIKGGAMHNKLLFVTYN